uniref:DUF3615 domain-containing protein n=1 Tax=Oryza meridionalis TaxID=40149 RepID=A0A0E0CU11_9ORYZ
MRNGWSSDSERPSISFPPLSRSSRSWQTAAMEISGAAESETRGLIGSMEISSETSRLIGSNTWPPRTLAPGEEPPRISFSRREAGEEGPRVVAPGFLGRMSLWIRFFHHRWRRERQDKQVARECLKHYNSAHQGSEFKLAPGRIIRSRAVASTPGHSKFWVHGNFLAYRKHTGCCSFLPGPRTLFFYEHDLHGQMTCVPLDDEPVDEVSLLGFFLGSGKRRSGRFDCVCETCTKRYALPYPFPVREFECGHQGMKILCRMCYPHSNVVHPRTGNFQCGHQMDAKFGHFQEMPF